MKSPGNRIATGIIMSLVASYVWALFFFILPESGWIIELPVAAGYAALLSSWYVLPLGGLLGWAMPYLIHSRVLALTFLRGALTGALFGLVVAGISALLWLGFRPAGEIIHWMFEYCGTLPIYCAVCIGAAACVGQRLH